MRTFLRRRFAKAMCGLLGVPVLAVGLASTPVWELRVCADPNRMPYSNSEAGGYDNQIASIVAEELGAELKFVWTSFNRWNVVLTDFLYTGECDVVFGLQDGEEGVLATAAYYQSPYVFVFRADEAYEIDSFDDPDLRNLRIGVQGGPAEAALRQRGIVDHVTLWEAVTTYDHENWLGDIIGAVVQGQIDVAVVWGPIAGYFARFYPDQLAVSAVPNEVEPPFIYLTRPMTAVVRPGDDSLRDALDLAFANRWEEIQKTLARFGVPLDQLPKPVPTRMSP